MVTYEKNVWQDGDISMTVEENGKINAVVNAAKLQHVEDGISSVATATNTAQTTADSKLPIVGGNVTGKLTVKEKAVLVTGDLDTDLSDKLSKKEGGIVTGDVDFEGQVTVKGKKVSLNDGYINATITRNTDNLSSTSGKVLLERFGNVVTIDFTFVTTASPTSGNVGNFPEEYAPASQKLYQMGNRLFIINGTSITATSKLEASTWYNGTVTYLAKNIIE